MNESLFGLPLAGHGLDDDEMVTDVVVIAKVSRLGTNEPRPAIHLFHNEGLDWITQIGMAQIAYEILNHYEGNVDE